MPQIMTSSSDPLRVDWLPQQARKPGRLGLTFAPGKHAAAKYEGGRWERDLGADLDLLVRNLGVQVLVCLLEDHESSTLS